MPRSPYQYLRHLERRYGTAGVRYALAHLGGRLVHQPIGDPPIQRTLVPNPTPAGDDGGDIGGDLFRFGRRAGWIMKSNLGTNTALGTHMLDAAANSGAATAFISAPHAYINYAGTGAAQGWGAALVVTRMELDPTYYATMMTGADVTNNAMQYGFHSNTLNAATTQPGRSVCFFVPASAGAQNWLAHTGNNTAPGANGNAAAGDFTQVDTGVALTADTRYVFLIEVELTEARFYINGTLVATITTDLPDATDLFWRGLAFSVAANARSIRNQLIYITTG